MLATIMLSLMNLNLLAEAGSQPAGGAGGGAAPNPLVQMLPVFAIMFAIFYFLVLRPQKGKTNQRKDMLANLRKGDKVLTIGGVIGTIVNIKDDELTLKVDESSNTKITFVRSAIDRVLSTRDGAKQEAA